MGEGFYVVTATNVRKTDRIDFTFMYYSGMPRADIHYAEDWGCVHRELPGPNEIFPFDIAKGVRRPEGLRRWHISTGNRNGWKASASADEESEAEAGLADVLKDFAPAILLMERGDFPDFEKACATAGLPVEVFHFDGELSTSKVLQPV